MLSLVCCVHECTLMLSFMLEQVIGSEDMDETDMGTYMSRFLEGYKDGNVIKKRISSPGLMDFMKSQFGVKIILIVIFLVLVSVLVLMLAKEEPLTVGTRDQADERRSSTPQQETRELRGTNVKED